MATILLGHFAAVQRQLRMLLQSNPQPHAPHSWFIAVKAQGSRCSLGWLALIAPHFNARGPLSRAACTAEGHNHPNLDPRIARTGRAGANLGLRGR